MDQKNTKNIKNKYKTYKIISNDIKMCIKDRSNFNVCILKKKNFKNF